MKTIKIRNNTKQKSNFVILIHLHSFAEQPTYFAPLRFHQEEILNECLALLL